jgi:hypothetical protein
MRARGGQAVIAVIEFEVAGSALIAPPLPIHVRHHDVEHDQVRRLLAISASASPLAAAHLYLPAQHQASSLRLWIVVDGRINAAAGSSAAAGP